MKSSKKKNKKQIVTLLLISLVAVWFLRTFAYESYDISSSQMANTILPGERIFVYKSEYGTRMPMTLLNIPFLHDSLPNSKLKSYSTAITFPYLRILYKRAKCNDIIVFNDPNPTSESIPIDKRKIRISRCVGVPNDTISLIDGMLFVNGKKIAQSPFVKEPFLYNSYLESKIKYAMLKESITSDRMEVINDKHLRLLTHYERFLVQRNLDENDTIVSVNPVRNNLNVIIPAKNVSYQITPNNMYAFCDIINKHESNKATVKNNQLYIKGIRRKYYVFKNDYYWMLSDNRETTADSRSFGVVPETHLIGKCAFIWFSADPAKGYFNGIRWNRIFKNIE